MSSATYTDRRNAASAEQTISIEAERISVAENGTRKRAIRFDEITQIRLGVEMAGRDSQVVCRIAGHDGTRIVFGSRAWKSVGVWHNQADTFRNFNTALHQALMPFRDGIEFVEGQPLWFGYAMSAMGLAIALLGFGFATYLALEENPIWLGGVPGGLLGLYIAWMFRPRAPQPYDPELYTTDKPVSPETPTPAGKGNG
ncbi:hypothetical protein [Hyphobacterium sp.]|uniref:hypothetical protein n=1 Tax=Hyphobacterium sp. TaxID=2004662 RepID=UPI003BACEDDA